VVEAIPYRPIPPGGATYVMDIPPIGADGTRLTVNSNLPENDTLWHFRSAWNVAALNCLEGHHQVILDGYGAFLRKHAQALTAANNAIDQRYRRDHGSRNAALQAREQFMTHVYNYFAMPPVRGGLCSVAVTAANAFLADESGDPKQLAAAYLPLFEAEFEQFFRAYEQYRIDSAAWDQMYGARYGASQPGYVAVYGTAGPSVGATLVDLDAPTPAGEVVDPDTGGRIPLIAVPEGTVSTPVVQPVPEE
jgi:hypothetical protein